MGARYGLHGTKIYVDSSTAELRIAIVFPNEELARRAWVRDAGKFGRKYRSRDEWQKAVEIFGGKVEDVDDKELERALYPEEFHDDCPVASHEEKNNG